MIKLTLLLLPLILSATMLKINEDINPIMLKSQHDKNYTLLSDGIWIITWDKSSSHIVNDYFKNNHFPKNVNLIVDATQIPFGLFSLFVKPKLKNYKHPVLLSFDEEYNLTLPYKKDYITILNILNKKIINLRFIKSLDSSILK